MRAIQWATSAARNAGVSNVRTSPEPHLIQDKAISTGFSSRNRLKGMRRRAAKMLTCIVNQQQEYQQAKAELAGLQQELELRELEILMQNLQQCLEQASTDGKLLPHQCVPTLCKHNAHQQKLTTGVNACSAEVHLAELRLGPYLTLTGTHVIHWFHSC